MNYWEWNIEISNYSRIIYFIFQFSVFASCIWGSVVRNIYIYNCHIYLMCWLFIITKFFFIWKLPPLLFLLFAWYIFLHPLGTLHLLHMYVVPTTSMQHMGTINSSSWKQGAQPGVMAEKQEGWEKRGIALWSHSFWGWALCISGSHRILHQKQG